ncbi:hypothetical protein HOJ01_03180 [bacterium]|jgi:hypothetical protein|nr:hypothetical protein [bacterium]MBT6293787.1 hypothetical protein [bacterium]
MFEDLNWDAFLEEIKNSSKNNTEDYTYDDERASVIELDIKDTIDNILNPSSEE